MKTTEEIITLLRLEIEEAVELYDQAKGKDIRQTVFYFHKIEILTHLLEEIKN